MNLGLNENGSAAVRKAMGEDIPQVADLFLRAVAALRARGIDQWDELYPTLYHHEADLAQGTLYLLELEGKIASAFTLNQDCDPEYAEGHWQYTGGAFLVIHRLCIDPDFRGKGVGRQSVLAIEALAREAGYAAIRFDAFPPNGTAIRLYESLGYAKVGEITFRKGQFYLYEKLL